MCLPKSYLVSVDFDLRNAESGYTWGPSNLRELSALQRPSRSPALGGLPATQEIPH